ncbi:glycosyltransferase family 9 protein [Sulfurimonas sp. SAG-AH-194-C21]|nr:glycosyltransferase family 9 protein [Sulfurimonas sp. SAG-AH-194-C21]MDF1884220.1 glycosyltransferase family 9 protein [Sulfurimonas sp. SAG-AH-194-C21]
MNILVVRSDKLGDFITALPAIYVLKQHNPQNKIIVCISEINAPLAKECDFIDEFIIDDKNESVFVLANKIKTKKIDVSITLYSNTRVAFAQFLVRIPKTIAPATKIAQIFYTHRVKQKRSEVKMAEFEYNLELTRKLFSSIDLNYKQPLLSFDNLDNFYEVFCLNHEIEKEVIAFHVGFGGSSDANLTLDEYENLIKNLLITKKYQIVMTFGPDEKDLYEAMQARFKDLDVVFYLSTDGLVYFAKLISQFKLFVSTSTGTYHLASLVGTTTMTFFGNSLFASASRWKSVGNIEKQTHFMLPHEGTQEREKMFKKVKLELLSL